MTKKLFIFILFLPFSMVAQLKLSGYGEVYYASDGNAPANGVRDNIWTNHHLHNQIMPNLMLIEAKYQQNNVYTRIGIMFGSYTQRNMQNEHRALAPLYEAVIGLDLGGNFELEAGIFESGIGLESVKGAENPTLSRSLSAESTPYFLTGLRLRWEDETGILLTELGIINGWETISRHAETSNPGVNARIRLGSKKVHINYNYLYANDIGNMTIFPIQLHSTYFKHTLNKNQWFIGFDIVRYDGEGWFTPHLTYRREINDRWAVYARGEYMQDDNSSFIYFHRDQPNELGGPTEIYGGSLGIDFKVHKNALIRVEGRYMEGENRAEMPIPGMENWTYDNFTFFSSLCISF